MKFKLQVFICMLILHIAFSCNANKGSANKDSANKENNIKQEANTQEKNSTKRVSNAKQEKSNQSFWEVGVGAFAISTPHYAGSDQSQAFVLPFPFINYESKRLSLNREGVKGHLLKTSRWNVDLSFAGTFPVDSNDNRARQGMPDLDWVGLGGPALTYRLSRNKTDSLNLILPLRFGVSTDFGSIDYVGWESVPSLRWQRDLEKQDVRWQIITAASVFYASEKYNNYTYAVDPQFATSDRPIYQSSTGNAGYEFILGGTARYQDFWMGAFLRFRSLDGSIIEDSPLVKQKANYYVGFSFAWIVKSSDN